MKTEFEIKVTIKDMYRFLMYHTYTQSFHGIISIVAGVLLISFYAIRRASLYNSWIYLLFGGIFLLYLPWTLYTKAATQVKLGTAFHDPLTYVISDEGIEVKQGDAQAVTKWQDVYRVCESKKNILVYTSKSNAFIWAKDQFLGQLPETKEILKKNLDRKQLKIK